MAADAHALVVLDRQQMRDRGETLVSRADERTVRPLEATRALAFHAARKTRPGHIGRIPLGLTVAQVIDAADVDQLLEMKRRFVAQDLRNGEPVFRQHLDRGFAEGFADAGDLVTELRRDALCERGGRHLAHTLPVRAGSVRDITVEPPNFAPPVLRSTMPASTSALLPTVLVRRIFFCSCRMP